MNRDREALSKKLLATRDRYLIAQPDKPDSAWAVLTECAEALALPVGGGVEEDLAIRITREGDHYRFGVEAAGQWVTSETVRLSGQGAGKDFNAALERIALSLMTDRATRAEAEVERLQHDVDRARGAQGELLAHAERLRALMVEMFEGGPVQVAFAGNPIAVADLESRVRAALSEGGDEG